MLFHKCSKRSTVMISPLTIATCFCADAGAAVVTDTGVGLGCCAASGTASAASDSTSIRFIEVPPDVVQTTRCGTGLREGHIPGCDHSSLATGQAAASARKPVQNIRLARLWKTAPLFVQ